MAVEYHESLELLLKKRAEHCQALFWAHNHAAKWCATWDTRIALSSIILGLFSGAGAVGADTLLPFSGSSTLVGVVSLVVSTIQAVNNKLAFAKRSEGHRISSLAYQKLYSKLNVQLNMPRHERIAAKELLDWLTAETERMTEVEPTFPENTKEVFHKKFGDMKEYAMPPILNGLESIQVVHHAVAETPVARPTVRVMV
jgi:hypothetical protein